MSWAHRHRAWIGYLLEQELGHLLPMEAPFATILTMIEVDPLKAFQLSHQVHRSLCARKSKATRQEGEPLDIQAGWREVAACGRVATPQADLRNQTHPLAAGARDHQILPCAVGTSLRCTTRKHCK